MGKEKARRGASMKSGSTVDKGRMLEKIVAEMHQQAGAVTQTNVRLPPIHNAKGQKREIDVLVSTTVVNHEVRIAFECKNERKLTGSQALGIFASKLEYVGIPVRNGIFVSVAGYTQGALEYAKEVGMKVLVYEDLNKRLPEAIISAVQSVLYVMCEIQNWNIVSTMPPQADGTVPPATGLLIYTENAGELERIYLGDLLWHMWAIDGSIPDKLGQHDIDVPVPDGAFLLFNDTRYPLVSLPDRSPIRANVMIAGFVFSINGTVNRRQLVNAQTQQLDQYRLDVLFDPNSHMTMKHVKTEDEFNSLKDSTEQIRLIAQRFRMPRIIFQHSYWPLSQRVVDLFRAAEEALQRGKPIDAGSFRFEVVEGPDINRVWEPISPEWPLYWHYVQNEDQPQLDYPQ